MSRRRRSACLGIAVVLLAGSLALPGMALATAPPPSTYVPTYLWTDLGVLPTRTATWPAGLNDGGEVTGQSYDDLAVGTAFRYSGTTLTDLGVLNQGDSSVGQAINASGVVAGESFGGGLHSAVTWSGTTITDISNGQNSWANDINDGGDVVGRLQASGHGFLYHSSSLTDLNALVTGGDTMTLNEAKAINNAGDVVGTATTVAGFRAFLFHAGTVTNLGVLSGSPAHSFAVDINVSGHVLANNQGATEHAFLWDGSRHDLGTLVGYPYNAGFGMNDADWVVGTMSPGNGNEHAFVWAAGRMVDLNTRVKLPSGWVLRSASDINNVGQITTQAFDGSAHHALLLTPSTVTRIFGSTRYETAANISHDNYGTNQPVVYVANGTNFPDALAGAAAAGHFEAPLLLVPGSSTTMPQSVRDELTRLAPTKIVVLGSNGSVNDTIFNQLKSYATTVVRLAGPNRYETAVAISQDAYPGTGGPATHLVQQVWIATGRTFPDALAAAAVAGRDDAPLILVDGLQPTINGLPNVLAELQRLNPVTVKIAGSAGSASQRASRPSSRASSGRATCSASGAPIATHRGPHLGRGLRRRPAPDPDRLCGHRHQLPRCPRGGRPPRAAMARRCCSCRAPRPLQRLPPDHDRAAAPQAGADRHLRQQRLGVDGDRTPTGLYLTLERANRLAGCARR